jgi:hypothetical protein
VYLILSSQQWRHKLRKTRHSLIYPKPFTKLGRCCQEHAVHCASTFPTQFTPTLREYCARNEVKTYRKKLSSYDTPPQSKFSVNQAIRVCAINVNLFSMERTDRREAPKQVPKRNCKVTLKRALFAASKLFLIRNLKKHTLVPEMRGVFVFVLNL